MASAAVRRAWARSALRTGRLAKQARRTGQYFLHQRPTSADDAAAGDFTQLRARAGGAEAETRRRFCARLEASLRLRLFAGAAGDGSRSLSARAIPPLAAKHAHLDTSDPLPSHAKYLGGRFRKVEDAIGTIRPAIVDMHDHRAAIAHVGNTDARPKGECPVRGGHGIGIEIAPGGYSLRH